jgi:hypothetical protein
MTVSNREPKLPQEQHLYARLVARLVAVGLALLVIAYGLYISGMLPAKVPVAEIPEYWHLDAQDYSAATDTPRGWTWPGNLHRGDSFAFGALAFMAGVSIMCLVAVLPYFLRRRDFAYASVVLAEVAVLVIAAGGFLGGG